MLDVSALRPTARLPRARPPDRPTTLYRALYFTALGRLDRCQLHRALQTVGHVVPLVNGKYRCAARAGRIEQRLGSADRAERRERGERVSVERQSVRACPPRSYAPDAPTSTLPRS